MFQAYFYCGKSGEGHKKRIEISRQKTYICFHEDTAFKSNKDSRFPVSIMTQTGRSHKGFDLDVLDLSELIGNPETPQEDPFRTESDEGEQNRRFVELIMKRIKGSDFFLSFARRIKEINKILSMKYSSAKDIADIIATDPKLSSKLLSLVNSSFYGRFSDKQVTTISEAMIIMGTEEIQFATVNLKLLELLQEISANKILKKKTVEGLLRSVFANETAEILGFQKKEGIQLAAMLYDLGEYAVILFYPERYMKTEIMKEKSGTDLNQSSKELFGVSYSDLGRLICKQLGVPPQIIRLMAPVKTPDSRIPEKYYNLEIKRCICSFANETCRADADYKGKNREDAVKAVMKRYESLFNPGFQKVNETLRSSRQKILNNAGIFNISSA
jgi:HD-like signal output (HDOD) protein